MKMKYTGPVQGPISFFCINIYYYNGHTESIGSEGGDIMTHIVIITIPDDQTVICE